MHLSNDRNGPMNSEQISCCWLAAAYLLGSIPTGPAGQGLRHRRAQGGKWQHRSHQPLSHGGAQGWRNNADRRLSQGSCSGAGSPWHAVLARNTSPGSGWRPSADTCFRFFCVSKGGRVLLPPWVCFWRFRRWRWPLQWRCSLCWCLNGAMYLLARSPLRRSCRWRCLCWEAIG